MIDWGRSYTSHWMVYRIDPISWRECGTVAKLRSASVERTREGCMESGTMAVSAEVGGAFEPGYMRIVLDAEQDGSVERVNVSTMYFTATSGSVERGVDSLTLSGVGVLYPASVSRFHVGAFAPKGADGAAWAAGVLGECLRAPVEVDGSFVIGRNIVFDIGSTRLEAIQSVLASGGFCLQVDGRGTVRVMKLPESSALDLGSIGAELLLPGITHAIDYSGVPNRYVARDGKLCAEAVNDDPDSPTSVSSRGYRHDVVDMSPRPVEGETLQSYARRMLAEASVVEESRKYVREFYPGVYPNSLVTCTKQLDGMDGGMRVSRQSIAIGRGIVVTEESVKEVSTWQA